MIELKQVSKRFGARTAVDDLTLGVPRGEIFGLLGHNGAGKSTAIGMMLGQVWPTCGQVRIGGFDVTAQRQQALQNVGAIFETPVFYDYLSGWQHYGAAILMLAIKAATILGLAFMFSCFNVKPAAATILALSFVFVNFILQSIPYFKDLQHWFLTYHLNLWQLMFAQPIPWWRIGESLSLLLGFNLTFLVIGATAFHVRDIKS